MSNLHPFSECQIYFPFTLEGFPNVNVQFTSLLPDPNLWWCNVNVNVNVKFTLLKRNGVSLNTTKQYAN